MRRNRDQEPNTSQGRRTLLLLAAFFALPVVLVLAMYQTGWQPGGGSHGQLVSPPQPLQITAVQDMQGRPFAAAQWKDKWHLVYVVDTACTANCREQLRLLRQIHVSLNKEIDRVQRVLLLASATSDPVMSDLQRQYPDLVILTGPSALAQQFTQSGQAPGHVYLVDPMGNLMMRYPDGYAPKGLRRDLERLLRYSWVG